MKGDIGNFSNLIRYTYLDDLVPTARYDDGVHDVGAEAYTRYPIPKHSFAIPKIVHGCDLPLGVAIILDVVFALAQGVPELDRPVARARNNLTVVRREADGEDIRGVADETTSRHAGVEVPETKSVIP